MIADTVAKHFKKNNEKKAIEKEVKSLAVEIKKEFQIGDVEDFKELGLRVDYQRRETNSTNQDLLITKIKELGKTRPEVLRAITTVERVDEEIVLELISAEVISLELLQECITTKVVGALVIKKI